MQFTVNHNYAATVSIEGDLTPVSYEAGTTVDIDEALAEWVNRDSPDTLSPVKGGKPSKAAAES